MTTVHPRARELFRAALGLPPGAVAAYLEEACAGDRALRAEVEALLELQGNREPVALGPAGPATEATLFHLAEAVAGGAGDGRYRELSELGRGGCGRVTRSWDDVLKRSVAHKEVLYDDEVQRGMLRHEARILAWLDHPGAVPVYDGRFEGTKWAYTMRLLEGETLRRRLHDQRRLTIAEAIRVLARISETMANAHAKGVLHLDLKPANIMLMPYGQVCILDWGVARFHDVEAYQAYLGSAGDPELARSAGYDGVAGTPAYMPLEQAVGEGVTPAADIFACGTMLYEMLVGRLPYPVDDSEFAILRKAVVAVTPLRAQRANVPEALEALCLRMIALDPTARPASFDEVLAALDRLNHGDVVVQQRTLQPGEVLFAEGDAGDEAFQVQSGCLSIRIAGAAGPIEIARRGVGELVGEMAVVSAAPRSATVVALEPTRVAVVTGQVIEDELSTANPLLARMVRSLVARLREEADRARRG